MQVNARRLNVVGVDRVNDDTPFGNLLADGVVAEYHYCLTAPVSLRSGRPALAETWRKRRLATLAQFVHAVDGDGDRLFAGHNRGRVGGQSRNFPEGAAEHVSNGTFRNHHEITKPAV